MKNFTSFPKCCALILLGVSLFSFHANATIVLSEDFSKCTAGTMSSPGSDITSTLDTYMGLTGWTANKIYQVTGAVKLGSSTNSAYYLTTPSINLSAFSGTFYLSFDACAWSGDSSHVKVYLDDVLVKDVYGLGNTAAYTLSSFGPYTITGGTATSKIKIIGLAGTKCRFFLDNIKVEQYDATAPRATLSTSTFFTEAGVSQSKDLSLLAYNLTGDLSVSLTNTEGTAFSTTVATVTAAQAQAGFSIPVVYAPTVAGKGTATISITGGGLASAVTATVTGEGWVATDVASLAALRTLHTANLTDVSTIYKLTGNALVSFTHATGNTKFVQDETGGVCVYDTKGLITTAVAAGDLVSGLCGTLVNYSGLMELVPVKNIASVVSSGNAITPVVLSIADVTTNKERYEGTVIKVNNLKTPATGTISASLNYKFGNGADSIVMRTAYTGLDYIGTTFPTAAVNLTGLLIEYSTVPQLVPRSAADIVLYTGLNETKVASSVLGRNGVLSVRALQGATIEVFNLMGRKVLATTATGSESSFTLDRGLYIVRVDGESTKVAL
jgi:hypothetical protein